MSKEIEALNKIKHASFTVVERDDTSGSITIMPIVNTEEYETIKNYLTPPTADEVCEALSEYYGFNYYYQDKFFYRSDGIKYIYPLKVSGFVEIQLYDGHLPPHSSSSSVDFMRG